MSETVIFKSFRQEQEWDSKKLDQRLTAIFLQASRHAFDTYGWIFCVTDIYRTPEEDRELGGHGVHPAWRAIDVRTKDRPGSDVKGIADWINSQWIYDPDRPSMLVAYVHDNGNGTHLHIQIHPHSRKRAASQAS